MTRNLAHALAAAILAAGFTGTAAAQHGPPPPRFELDARYHHDHWYPRRGYTVGVLPGGAVAVGWHGGNYWFHGGVWYRPYGRSYIVAAPPRGILVPILPPSYATVWLGGAPYYYANGVYYASAPGGYTVVDPPPGADSAEPAIVQAAPPAAPAPRSVDPIIYPRNGQSPQQTDADRAECNLWAGRQPHADSDISVFQRGFAACLDAHGYTVR